MEYARKIRLTSEQLQELLVRLGWTAQGAINISLIVCCGMGKDSSALEAGILQHPERWGQLWWSKPGLPGYLCVLADLEAQKEVGMRPFPGGTPAYGCDYELVLHEDAVPPKLVEVLREMGVDTQPFDSHVFDE